MALFEFGERQVQLYFGDLRIDRKGFAIAVCRGLVLLPGGQGEAGVGQRGKIVARTRTPALPLLSGEAHSRQEQEGPDPAGPSPAIGLVRQNRNFNPSWNTRGS